MRIIILSFKYDLHNMEATSEKHSVNKCYIFTYNKKQMVLLFFPELS